MYNIAGNTALTFDHNLHVHNSVTFSLFISNRNNQHIQSSTNSHPLAHFPNKNRPKTLRRTNFAAAGDPNPTMNAFGIPIGPY
jgi:hypothetical protein